jgi:glutaredoxin
MNIPVVYISLIDDPHAMKKMLAHARGQRKIPVIVDGEEVTVGFQGKG